MQSPEALIRVAAECAEDLADDGVVYAEVRFAPELHTRRDLGLDDVVHAVLDGFTLGTRAAAEQGRTIRVRALLTAMRHAARSREIAELCIAFRDRGVAGFDIAGAEAGFPPVPNPAITNASAYCAARYRHNGGSVYLLADGHAKWFISPRSSWTAPSTTGVAYRKSLAPNASAWFRED